MTESISVRTTIDSRGRIVIPKAIRDAAGIAPGGSVEIERIDHRVRLTPAPPARDGAGATPKRRRH